MIVQITNEEKMVYKSVCKGLEWKMQGICFMVDVFIIELYNCNIILGVQLLSMLGGGFLCNYKHMWVSFN
jgi:hypothetical protein